MYIAKRILETFPCEEIFNKAIRIYSKALKKSSFTDDLKYLPNKAEQIRNNKGRKCKRKII